MAAIRGNSSGHPRQHARDCLPCGSAGAGARLAADYHQPAVGHRRGQDHPQRACALNLLRLEAYWTGTPLDRRRTSHLARLELSLAA